MKAQLKLKREKFEILHKETKINQLKPYGILNLISEEIRAFNEIKVFPLKKQLLAINEVFETQIKYDAFIKFVKKINISQSQKSLEPTPKIKDVETEIIIEDLEETNIDTSEELTLKPAKLNFKTTKQGIQDYAGEIK